MLPLMMKSQIKDLALKRGIENASQFKKAVGLNLNVAYGLWAGEFEYVTMTTLSKLCRYFRCQPGRLLRYVPDTETESNEVKSDG